MRGLRELPVTKKCAGVNRRKQALFAIRIDAPHQRLAIFQPNVPERNVFQKQFANIFESSHIIFARNRPELFRRCVHVLLDVLERDNPELPYDDSKKDVCHKKQQIDDDRTHVTHMIPAPKI